MYGCYIVKNNKIAWSDKILIEVMGVVRNWVWIDNWAQSLAALWCAGGGGGFGRGCQFSRIKCTVVAAI